MRVVRTHCVSFSPLDFQGCLLFVKNRLCDIKIFCYDYDESELVSIRGCDKPTLSGAKHRYSDQDFRMFSHRHDITPTVGVLVEYI